MTLTASLTDPDGGVSSVTWSWARSADESRLDDYSQGRIGFLHARGGRQRHYLRATASYADGQGPGKSANGTTESSVPSNAPPEFPLGSGARSVAENTAAGEEVGAPVAATDADGDVLTYSLSGADAASFTIDEDTGQIRVGSGTALDYEADKNVYEVTVTATDSSGASATVAVTITVTDVDLPGIANDYDVDNNETIARDEAIAAVADYFAGVISKDEAIAVVQRYFAG